MTQTKVTNGKRLKSLRFKILKSIVYVLNPLAYVAFATLFLIITGTITTQTLEHNKNGKFTFKHYDDEYVILYMYVTLIHDTTAQEGSVRVCCVPLSDFLCLESCSMFTYL